MKMELFEGVMRHTVCGAAFIFSFAVGGIAEANEYRQGYLLVRFNERSLTPQSDTTRQAVLNAAARTIIGCSAYSRPWFNCLREPQ